MVTLNGTNTYTGNTSIVGSATPGAVSVSSIGNAGASGNLGAGTAINLGAGAFVGKLIYTGTGESTSKKLAFTGTTGGVVLDQSGTGALVFSDTAAIASTAGAKSLTLQGSTAGTGEIDGVIQDSPSGTTTVTKTGSGTWALGGTNTYTGTTTINGGTLVARNVNALGNSPTPISMVSGNLAMATDTSINAYNISATTANTTQTFISDRQTAGLGITQTLGNLTVSGTTQMLNFTSGANVTGGTPIVAFGNVVTNGNSGTVTFNPTTAGVIFSTFSAASTFKTNTLVLGGSATTNEITGAVSNGASSNTVTVLLNGTGAWTFDGASTYTGTTTVSSGSLFANNTTGSATGTNTLSVASGATIGGKGIITAKGNLINGNVAVGLASATDINTNQILTMTATGSTTFTNANLIFNLSSTLTGSGTHLATVATPKVLFNGSNTITLDLQGASLIPNGTTYTLVTSTIGGSGLGGSVFGGTGVSLLAGNIVSGLNLNFVNGVDTYSNSVLNLVSDGGGYDIVLTIGQAVPEPGAWAMMLGGLGLLVVYQRSRRKNS